MWGEVKQRDRLQEGTHNIHSTKNTTSQNTQYEKRRHQRLTLALTRHAVVCDMHAPYHHVMMHPMVVRHRQRDVRRWLGMCVTC
jgi:hypothetical protein